jgi:hypothetical protein
MLRSRLLLACLLPLVVPAATYFVSPAGDDASPGSAAKPFRTIQHAVDLLQPGDTCFVRAGTYRETVKLEKKGTAAQPIRIRAYPGERVVLDGTEPITGWKPAGNKLYTAKTSLKVEQLFAGNRMLVEARWPNCTLDRILTRDGWASAGPKSEYGKIRDPELAKTNIDWNGAMAILNVAHQFWSWSRIVEGYEKGSEVLPYTITMNEFHTKNRHWWDDDFYYLMGKREALDVVDEWVQDKDGTVTLMADALPRNTSAKQRDYAFVANGSAFVEISGFHFFACSFRIQSSDNCLVEYCNLLYPSYARGVPNAEEKGHRKPCPGTLVNGKENTIRSCSFVHCPNFGVVLQGEKNTLEDSIVADVNWTGTLHYTAVALRGMKGIAKPRNVARHNTLYNVGNTILNCSGPDTVVEYNHVHHGGLICADVSLLYTCMPAAMGVEFRYNWVHDSLSPNNSLGIRGDDKTRGLHVHHNVLWNVARDGIVTKGGENRVYNNTCFANQSSDIMFCSGPEPDKWWQKHVKAYQEQNMDSLLINNCARAIVSTRRPHQPPMPGDNSNNYTKGDPKLVDPDHFDFRPRADSPLVDAGRAVAGITAPYVGKAPDIGAYEYKGDHWLPGHRNGICASQGAQGLQACLNLPILEPIRVLVQQGGKRLATLAFTPKTWDQPQPLPAAARTGKLIFATDAWGAATLTDASAVRELADARAQFERPDLASARVMDSSPKFDYEESYTRDPVAAALFRAYAVQKAPKIDGRLDETEWPGWSPERAMPFVSLAKNAPDMPPTTEGYALFDADSLYVAVKVSTPGDKVLREGGAWGPGGTDGVEVDLATYAHRRIGPAFVLHAWPSGKVESVTIGGAEPAAAATFGKAVTYAARILDDQSWTCEFRIPFTSFGVDPSDVKYLRFNLGLRRNGATGGPWFAAVNAHGPNYAMAEAAVLQFDPRVRADAANLVTNGRFEAEDLAPWRLSTNSKDPVPEDTVQRVEKGRRGDGCIQLQASDAEAMKQRVFKWTYPLPDTVVAPGTYCLSYEVRIPEKRLTPRGPMGSFNSYLHMQRNGKAGGNLGQSKSMLLDTGEGWLRRDFVIDVPANVTPSMISLQLHHATGTVLLDNVSLIRCQE